MATYARSDAAIPGAQSWPDVSQWSLSDITGLPTQIVLIYTDGTFGELNGTGIVLNGFGEPVAGTITSMRRLSTDGSTVLEVITDIDLSLVTLFNAPNASALFNLVPPLCSSDP